MTCGFYRQSVLVFLLLLSFPFLLFGLSLDLIDTSFSVLLVPSVIRALSPTADILSPHCSRLAVNATEKPTIRRRTPVGILGKETDFSPDDGMLTLIPST